MHQSLAMINFVIVVENNVTMSRDVFIIVS
jgi:hypothetical protein